MLTWPEYIKTFTALLVVVNPIGAIPVFVATTNGDPPKDRLRTARVAACSVGIVLTVTVLVGESLLRFFGVSIASFRVGGGILILLNAIAMFYAQYSRSRYTDEEAQEAEEKEDIAVVPLSIPLLAGPGAISTVIIYSNQAKSWGHVGILILISAATAFLVWLILRMAIPIGKMMGKTGINIATRLMGLLLAAIAIEFIAGGLSQLLPGLL